MEISSVVKPQQRSSECVTQDSGITIDHEVEGYW